jgi:hypothetical protein
MERWASMPNGSRREPLLFPWIVKGFAEGYVIFKNSYPPIIQTSWFENNEHLQSNDDIPGETGKHLTNTFLPC